MTKTEIAKYASLFMPIIVLPLMALYFLSPRPNAFLAIGWFFIFVQVGCLIYYMRNG